LKQRITSFGKLAERITWINGSSTDESTVDKVRSLIGHERSVMVILDSFHTHDHVMKELRLYSPLIGKGHYLVCCDTHVEYIPEIVENRPRPWGKGNNPKTAVDEFLRENDRFEVDRELENKLLLTLHPSGYLKSIKE
jgi:cephalosporin hydroxylase